jgi:N-hydroxyarylamine O-acetyltransferase
MDIEAYLKRIHYDGSRLPTLANLIELHRTHLLNVPFENLDIHLGRPIVLDEDKIIHKIVERRRGGFCYELNGAFYALLRALGYRVSMLSAEVAHADGTFDQPFDHMALLVELDEPWLADVGFGDSFREPLRMNDRGEQQQDGDAYRLSDAGEYLILERREGGEWNSQYRFTLQPYDLQDYAGMCHFHQTSPESTFTQRRTCTRATLDGRITVTGLRLINTIRGEKQERELAGDDEWRAALGEHFGIEL